MPKIVTDTSKYPYFGEVFVVVPNVIKQELGLGNNLLKCAVRSVQVDENRNIISYELFSYHSLSYGNGITMQTAEGSFTMNWNIITCSVNKVLPYTKATEILYGSK